MSWEILFCKVKLRENGIREKLWADLEYINFRFIISVFGDLRKPFNFRYTKFFLFEWSLWNNFYVANTNSEIITIFKINHFRIDAIYSNSVLSSE